MSKTGNKVMILAGGFLTLVAVFTTIVDLPEKFDPLVYTEAEAAVDRETINETVAASEQTQAGFNAYTLSQLLQQEISILKLKIQAETDPDEKELLKSELRSKQEFIRKLQEEERKQLLKKG